jgi:hypothetical protein
VREGIPMSRSDMHKIERNTAVMPVRNAWTDWEFSYMRGSYVHDKLCDGSTTTAVMASRKHLTAFSDRKRGI